MEILELEPAGPFKLFDVPVETHSTIVLHKAERGDALLCSSIFSTIGTNGSIGASEQPGHWSSPPVTHRLGSPPTVPRSWCWQSLRACRSRLASGSENWVRVSAQRNGRKNDEKAIPSANLQHHWFGQDTHNCEESFAGESLRHRGRSCRGAKH